MQEEFLDHLLAIPSTYSGAVSPDGRWLAFLCRGAFTSVAKLYLVSAEGGEVAKSLLDDIQDWDCDYFYWSFDSRFLILAQSKNGDERERLLQVPITGGEARLVTEEHPHYFIHGGMPHPDGQHIVYMANRDPESGKEIEHSVLYRHNLETGERVALARLKSATYDAPQISSDGKYVLYGRMDLHPAGHQLWLVGFDGKGNGEIANVGANAKVQGNFSPDGRFVLLRADAGTHRKIGQYDIEKRQTHWLIDDSRRNFEGFHWPRTSPLPLLEEYQNATYVTWLFDPATGKETRVARAKALGQVGIVGRNREGEWVISHYAAQYPLRYLLAQGEAGNLQVKETLSRVEEGEKQGEEDFLLPYEEYEWRSVDGMKIHGFLCRAKGKALGTILYIHGGPTYHYEDEFSVQVQYLVKCGFHVMMPNYRGSTGYGFSFQESIKREGWGGLEQEDIKTCAEALIRDGIAEKGKIGITGVSYGGYSSWWAITHFPKEIIAASIPICGMTDLVVDYEGTRPDLRPYSEEMLGGSPSQVPDRYKERSPIHFVPNIEGRLLIVQGLTDPNVTPLNLYSVQKKLEEAHIPYETLTFADEGHGIAKPANRKILYQRMTQFFTAAFQAEASGFGPETHKISMGPVG